MHFSRCSRGCTNGASEKSLYYSFYRGGVLHRFFNCLQIVHKKTAIIRHSVWKFCDYGQNKNAQVIPVRSKQNCIFIQRKAYLCVSQNKVFSGVLSIIVWQLGQHRNIQIQSFFKFFRLPDLLQKLQLGFLACNATIRANVCRKDFHVWTQF